MKLKYWGWILVVQLVYCNSCAKAESVERSAPAYKSSIPENNATDVELSSSLEITFDEVITLASTHNIKVNGELANVEADFTKLKFDMDLEPNTQYQVIIPKGAVINTFGIELKEEIDLMFTTEKEHIKDPDFYIYLCFGQSNMEGQGEILAQNKTVPERFQVMQALDCSGLGTKGNWRVAVPPLCQCGSGLSPADYFGRTMIENLPENIKVGVINVAIGGCDIRLFDKDIYQDYTSTYTDSWFTNKIQDYDGNPYQYLIDLAKQAQQDGVIKGILLHQGETNTGDDQWPAYVKKIYEDMLADLSLNAEETPLLAGEVFQGEDNCCSSMNPIINNLPAHISNSYVISSEGCTGQDNAHFDAEGYRELGKRYGLQMLSILGYENNPQSHKCK